MGRPLLGSHSLLIKPLLQRKGTLTLSATSGSERVGMIGSRGGPFVIRIVGYPTCNNKAKYERDPMQLWCRMFLCLECALLPRWGVDFLRRLQCRLVVL